MMYNSKSTKKCLSTVLLMILVMLPTMTNGRIANHQSPLLNPPHDPRRRRLLVLLAVMAFPEAILSKALAASGTSKHHNDISYGKSSVSSHSILERPTTGAESRDNSVRSIISSSTTTSLLPEFMIRRRDANLQMSFYWEQIGNSIYGEVAGDQSGRSVAMSDDGRRVIIGAYVNDGNGSNSGHARVYEDVDGTWMQVGQDLDGEAAVDGSGESVGMSSDGRRVIIGAPFNDGNGSNSGHARVYEDVDGTWTQVGEDLGGEAADDNSGLSVGMSSDGRRVIIGAVGNDGNGSLSGHARVYQDVDGTWMQVGQDLDGEAAGDRSGWSVAMSSDGRRVIIGATWNDGNGSSSGHARVYQDVDGTWMQVGEDLDGEAAGDQSGRSVSMSSDGRRVIIGAPYNDGNGSQSGQVRVFEAAVTTSSPSEVSTLFPSSSPSEVSTASAPTLSPSPENSDLAGSSLLIIWITAPILVLLLV